MVVEDDRLDAELDRARERVDGRGAAIDAHQDGDAVVGELFDRLDPDPVAVGEAAREVGHHVGAGDAQRPREDRGRADAVAVVVAVDRDPRHRG